MTDYYMRDGRYFGEDTSFYEFDENCLKKKGEAVPDSGTDEKKIENGPDSGATKKKVDYIPDNGADENTEKFTDKCGACSRESHASESEESRPEPPENFDRLFTNRKLDMLKTAIPFLPPRQQKVFACAVKLAEFRNLVGFFGQQQPTLLAACSEQDPGMRMADMLDALRGYCSPAEQEQIDSLLQVLMTAQMMRDGMEVT